jgi:predicted nucleic acid-binding protein
MPTIVSLPKSCYQYRVEDVGVITSIEHWDLGPGESQVIALCISGSRSAVLDDRPARRCAAAHNVPVIGTPGIVLRLKEKRLIESARPLEHRHRHSMRLDDQLQDAAEFDAAW